MNPVLPLAAIIPPMSYDTLARRVFAGEILCINSNGNQLLRAARALCREAFSTATPPTAHRLYDKEDFFARAAEAQKEFNTSYYKKIFAEWMQNIGINCDNLYWDTLGLRIAPPVATHAGGWRSAIGAHRDTWGTAIQAQINWWAPIWPLANRRTMGFYPDYWQRPLSNSTADWSFEEYLKSRKEAPAGHATPYPSAPRALETPETPIVPLRIKCGELLAFSSAHLHASIPNHTSLTRFSFEIRTISKHTLDNDDTCAPNVDCASSPPLYRLFRSIADNTMLATPDRK